MGKFNERKKHKSNSNILPSIILLAVGVLGFVFACFQTSAIGKFLMGTFGLVSFPIFLLIALCGVAELCQMSINIRMRYFFYILFDSLVALLLLHAIFSFKMLESLSYAEYLSACFNLTFGPTIGGIIAGAIVGIFGALLGAFGTCIIFGISLCVLVGLTIDFAIYNRNNKVVISRNRFNPDLLDNCDIEPVELNVPNSNNTNEMEPIEILPCEQEEISQPTARDILFGNNTPVFENDEPKSAKEILFGDIKAPDIFNSSDDERKDWLDANVPEGYKNDYDCAEENITPQEQLFGNRQNEFNTDLDNNIDKDSALNILGINRNNHFNDYSNYQDDENSVDNETNDSFNANSQSQSNFGNSFNREYGFDDNETEQNNTYNNRFENRFGGRMSRFDLHNEENETEDSDIDTTSRRTGDLISASRRTLPRFEQTEIGQVTKPEMPVKPVILDVKYNPPPITLLKDSKDDPSKYAKNYEENSRIIEERLETFKIPVKVNGVVRGPTVTRYELTMPSGIPVKKILSYDSDLAMALKSKQGVRIEAPIPGKDAVGIEIPNDPRSMVSFKELVESKEFQSSSMALPVAIGKSITGEVIVKNLAKMVHVLVAGSTGSGKSVFLHNVIMSLMFKLSPDQLRFIMIDPKRVEFSRYKGMPHMMLSDVVSDAQKAVNSLSWAVKEMERRYKLLEENKCESLAVFNQCKAVKNGQLKKLPYLVIIVDELAELMSVAKKDVEYCIRRISQLGRASGIHLVLATQRPSVEVITGTIKANLPNRIAFSLTNYVDSRTILDEPGAEKLLGQGDMLFKPQESNTPMRLQAAYITDEEINKCVDYIKANNITTIDDAVEREINAEQSDDNESDNSSSGSSQQTDHSDQMDELLPQALKYFIESKKGSINMVQRRFYVGYSRAARIVDQMEIRGYVSEAEGSKNREILITMDEFRKIFGDDV